MGEQGTPGTPGRDGRDGERGEDGLPGTPGRSPQFTRSGLNFEILDAEITGTTATAIFRVTDGNGTPLDVEGRFTEGTIAPRFVLAWLAVDERGAPTHYTAYNTRRASSTVTGITTDQATTDTGGTVEVVDWEDGVYLYRFGATINVANPDRTHTVAGFATRSFGGDSYVANSTYHFIPSGTGTPAGKEVVSDQSCNTCHGQLSAHGGARQDISLCITCHSPQTIDPDTGNTTDFGVMVHRIHRGASLPSVIAGTPYQFVGFGGAVHDYSTVHYPQAINNCEGCHTGGANVELWRTRPTREACLSCHEDIAFSNPPGPGQRLHSGGTQPNNAPCNVCHPATGSIAGITESHAKGLLALDRTTVEIDLMNVTNSAPGQAPVLTFRVRVNGQPRDILAQPLTLIRATFAGPNTDFARYWTGTIQGSGAAGTLTAVDAPNGVFQHAFAQAAAVPADAAGSFSVGLEAYLQPAGSPRWAASVTPIAFAVTDPTAVPRRRIVSTEQCNNCHLDLAFHGGGRKDPNYCINCHGPNLANAARSARFENQTIHIESADFRVMIHKIHAGDKLTGPYVLGGNPTPNRNNPAGSPHDFTTLRYPGVLSDCKTCHVGTTYRLPLAEDLLPSRHEWRSCTEPVENDPDDFCETQFLVTQPYFLRPATAVCTGCHDSEAAKAHAELQTTSTGREACAVCHGTGSQWDVDVVHKLR